MPRSITLPAEMIYQHKKFELMMKKEKKKKGKKKKKRQNHFPVRKFPGEMQF